MNSDIIVVLSSNETEADADGGATSRIGREPDNNLEHAEYHHHGAELQYADRDAFLDHNGGGDISIFPSTSQRSVFAVGFITFLILLTALQVR